MNIIGLNAYHGDSSACILVDGVLRAAVEEERFRRIKHWAGFPTESIKYCLEHSKLQLGDIDVIAINTDPKANFSKKIGYSLFKRPSINVIKQKLEIANKRLSIQDELGNSFLNSKFEGKIVHVEHHLAHLASAFYPSPFSESLILSVDGFGDFSSTSWGVGLNSQIDVKKYIHFPHSLGVFYQALTQYLGFPNYGDEYKVMGLAPYGKPNYVHKLQQLVNQKSDGSFNLNLKYFRHHKEDIGYQWENNIPKVKSLYSDELKELLGPLQSDSSGLSQKHYDIAHSVQRVYEQVFFHIVNCLHEKNAIDNISLAGGCAMNSVANGKIYRNTKFKKLYVQSAAGDAGGALGAAYIASNQLSERSTNYTMTHAYWGPGYSDDNIKELFFRYKDIIQSSECKIKYIADDKILFAETAEAISKEKVIGWFQGRMEWGPRALGNRSILCDPRSTNMKEILNSKIKRRESFRPFAPSILREHVTDWFEEDDDVPFMMKVFQILEEKRISIPAVTHVDGSGRLQTVFEETNSRYYQLIQAFYKLTDVPILLNTSFNENEPIVCNPEEALNCFLRTNMDILVCGNYFVSR